jgi:hypothetical protein
VVLVGHDWGGTLAFDWASGIQAGWRASRSLKASSGR